VVKRGEVWWSEHPEYGRRPVCVLTRDAAIPVLKNVTVVPATTKIRGIASEVRLGTVDGMPRECALSFDNVRTLRKARLTEQITTLGPDRLDEVCRALRYATDCA
jgi:mRNA interferase MazF